jgi:hypothetical protein
LTRRWGKRGSGALPRVMDGEREAAEGAWNRSAADCCNNRKNHEYAYIQYDL